MERRGLRLGRIVTPHYGVIRDTDAASLTIDSHLIITTLSLHMQEAPVRMSDAPIREWISCSDRSAKRKSVCGNRGHRNEVVHARATWHAPTA